MNRLSFPRSVRLMLGLRMRRFFNRLGAFQRRFGKKRAGGPAKRSASAFSVLLLMFFGLQVGSTIAWTAITNMAAVLPPPREVADAEIEKPAKSWPGTEAEWREMNPEAQKVWVMKTEGTARRSKTPEVVDGLGFLAGVLLLMMFAAVVGVAASDLGKLDHDVEWMLAMPVSATAIYAAKAAERTLLSLPGWFSVGPLVTIAAAYWGKGLWSPVWGIGAALLMNGVVSGLTIGVELASHRLLGPQGRRNLQAAAVLAQVVLMLGAMAFGTAAGRSDSILYTMARACGPATRWLPGGLVFGIMHGTRAGTAQFAALAAWGVGAVVFAAAATAWAAARGLEAVQAMSRRTAKPGRTATGDTMGGILGKEIKLLLRDRVLFVQIALLPVFVVATQVLLNPGFFQRAMASPLISGAVAFGVGAYTLLTSAPGVLFHERDALWLLYTFPRPVSGLISRKVVLWSSISMAWALATMGYAVAHRGGPQAGDLPGFLWIMIGLPCYAVIASSVGILGFDPTAVEVHRRLRVDLQYLVMVLGGLLGAGLFMPTVHDKGALLAIFAAIAFAMSRSAADRFHYLLDPAADPPRRLEAVDGLVCVAFFFSLVSGVVRAAAQVAPGEEPVIRAFASPMAGALVLGVGVLMLRQNGLPFSELPRFVPERLVPGTLLAVGAGAAAAGVSVAWELFLRHLGQNIPVTAADLFLAPLTLLALPFCEEFLFRGMVFQPLRRSLSFLPAAAVSAGLFAIVAPPLAFVPALALGLATCFVMEKSKGLLAAILANVVCAGGVLAARFVAHF